jgi:SWI/SNF-related matrix-associated actin-dependent regulator of chromatin subfamily A member 5
MNSLTSLINSRMPCVLHSSSAHPPIPTPGNASVGAAVAETSTRWNALSEEEKAPYEEAARKDKDRYLAECAERNAEMLIRQEEARKKNAVGEVLETNKRASTQAKTNEATFMAETFKPKKKTLSAEDQQRKDEREEEKKYEEIMIKKQHDELKKHRAAQASNRLTFLLQQSDIFAHFGVHSDGVNPPDKKKTASATSSDKDNDSSTSSARNRSRGSKDDLPDFDDDEKALMAETEGENSVGSTLTIRRQPSIITGGKLREYQLEGLSWMARLAENGINGILADEMGLGKTLQSIAIIAYSREFKNMPGPHLIMVPKSTLSNWMNEFTRFTPTIRVMRFHGTKEHREELIHSTLLPGKQHSERDWDVCLTTYEICNLEKGALQKIAWRYLIIDEAHRLKNEDSQFAKTVRAMDTQHRLLLTGTPLQNNLHELWALLNFLLPEVFASSEQFDEWFNLDVEDVEAKQ